LLKNVKGKNICVVISHIVGRDHSTVQIRIVAITRRLSEPGSRGKSLHGFHPFRHSAASIVHAETRDLTLAREIWQNCGLPVAETSVRVNQRGAGFFARSG
jgi:hypothetical protein